jgi:mannitol/fructose-specific phosphotransferase system IIA component (Ntr-type)
MRTSTISHYCGQRPCPRRHPPRNAAFRRDHAIRELVGAVPLTQLSAGTNAAEVTAMVMCASKKFSTVLGTGIAISHARFPELAAPLVVLGRS